MELHDKLVNAITEYDRKESRKRYYNPHALALSLGRLRDVEEDIRRGASIRNALIAGFCGRMLDALLKAAGEEKSTKEDQRRGTWYYLPASEL